MRAPLVNRGRGLPYLPGLDGLRALAVIAVVVYHSGQGWIPGGFLGVEVFFVISGYIITSGLAAEWRDGGIRFKAFWSRRAVRLLPALLLLLGSLLVITGLFVPDELARVKRDSLAAAGYVTNWTLILDKQSYFETFGPPPLLQHLWSLAVEEQFYIIWPVVLATLLRFLKPRLTAAFLVTGALASAGLMAVLFVDVYDTSRLYYGTDTRASGLLLGSALALVLTPGVSPGKLASKALTAAGIAGLAALAVLAVSLSQYEPILYQGGFLLTGLASAAVIACVSRVESLPSRIIGVFPLRWLGTRSYGIYLWHWPLLLLTAPASGAAGWSLAVRLLLVVFVAEMSYRLIEMPARRGALGRLLRALVAPPPQTGRYRRAFGMVSASVGVVALAVAVLALSAPTARASRSSHVDMPLVVDVVHADAEEGEAELLMTWETTGDEPVDGEPAPEAAEEAPPEPEAPPPPPLPAAGLLSLPGGLRVTAVGDSVLLGASRQLAYTLGAVDVDADVGRQVSTGIEILRDRVSSGSIGEVVIVGLGSNGGFSGRQFEQIMEQLAGSRLVVFVNVRVPRPWEEPNNRAIARGVEGYANAVLVDWYGASEGHPELFGEDKVHLTGTGARLYAGLISDAIAANLK